MSSNEPIEEEVKANETTEVQVSERQDDNKNVDGGEQDDEHLSEEDYKSKKRAQEAFYSRDVEASRSEHAKRVHNEPHSSGASDYVKSIVFGGLDGIITTFAIIAAAAGADLGYKTVLVFGFANVLADAWSMGFGEFISGNAERDHAMSERSREEWEVENAKDMEIKEMVDLYVAKGLSQEDSETMVSIISKDDRIFVDFMMVEELGILTEEDDAWGAAKQGAVMFVSFVFFGCIPLYSYTSGHGKGTDYIFGISVSVTCLALLLLGSLKGYLTSVNIPKSAVVMLCNGCISGGVSYGVGVLVEYIVGGGAAC